MEHARRLEDVHQIEQRLLRILCNEGASKDQRQKALRLLAHYSWRDPEHQIVFEALRRLGVRHSELIRANLAAELTRTGFPDLELAAYFSRDEKRPQDILALISQLRSASAGRP